MEYEERLIPILREGIHIVKMFLYKELRQGLSEKYTDREQVFVGRLTGGHHQRAVRDPEPGRALSHFQPGERGDPQR